MLIAHELAGVRVLVAHEDGFQKAYLSAVLAAAGAILVDPSAAGDAALTGPPPLDAAVVSQIVQATDGHRLIDAAARGALAVLVVHSASALPLPAVGLLRSLAVPYAAFQVVEAIRDMLGHRHDQRLRA
ncbi:hypothetical protein GCM10022253_24730 [Sphingomonas endophytica]|uniref:Uncharacterized protein n=1 Tax=Sphingomonas endophytica TaxID=869719 RepID=A0A7X0JG77_9SPHN|nr:hypothetical protein [Sphingomonas endophytica]MBB5725120.1 hypothetical protein [Sphingomonas endophytica]MBB6506137.1 hypothetical protein [Sphingomonas endophytica]